MRVSCILNDMLPQQMWWCGTVFMKKQKMRVSWAWNECAPFPTCMKSGETHTKALQFHLPPFCWSAAAAYACPAPCDLPFVYDSSSTCRLQIGPFVLVKMDRTAACARTDGDLHVEAATRISNPTSNPLWSELDVIKNLLWPNKPCLVQFDFSCKSDYIF